MAIINGLIIDMDGVIWRSNEPIGDLVSIFNDVKRKNIKYVFATNNSTLTLDKYIDKLNSFGLSVSKNQIVTSAIATASYLSDIFPEHSNVYVIGEKGLENSITERALQISKDTPRAVVVGMDRFFTYEKLKYATLAIRSGSKFIGTNPDKTYPANDGIHPGTGSILAAIEAATDTSPYIIGKPYPALYKTAIQLLESEPDNVLVIGDRLETDIEGAVNLGLKAALVLSGVTDIEMANRYTHKLNFIANTLEEIVKKLPQN